MGKINGNYFISDKDKPCYFCGKLTNRIDILTEKRICGIECEDILKNESKTYDVLYLRFNSFNTGRFELLDKFFLLDNKLFNNLMKVNEKNILEVLIKVFNLLNDTALINCNNLDNTIEMGDITCFEKNKKTIKNKSKNLKCYLNFEMKTLYSFLSVQLVQVDKEVFEKHKNIYYINERI